MNPSLPHLIARALLKALFPTLLCLAWCIRCTLAYDGAAAAELMAVGSMWLGPAGMELQQWWLERRRR
jgi:hypothetical protein